VVATGLANTLALGGTTNATFDASSVGPTAQYRGFTAYAVVAPATWTLTGSTTALTPWTVNAGTLAISSDASLGSTTGRLTLDGGGVRALATLVTARPITLGTGGGTVDVNGNLFGIAGLIDGTGALTVTSSTTVPGNGNNGSLVLPNANTFSGGTTIQNGASVTAQVSGSLGTGSVLLQTHDAQLVLTGTAQAGATTYTVGRAATADYGNRVSLSQNTSANSATFAVNGSNWRNAATTNTLQFGDSATAADASIANAGGRVYFTQTATAANATILNGAQGLLSFIGGTPSAGAAQITNATGGTVVFADGATALNATIANQAGGVVDVSGMTNGGIAIGSLAGAGRVVLGASALTLGGLNDNTTISGVISDSGSEFVQPGTGIGGRLVKTGTGMVTLAGLNTYTGATSVSQGTLRAGAANALAPASSFSVASGATLDLAGNSQTVASLANSGVVSLLGTVPGTTLRVNGAYVGNNGVLKLGTTLSATGPTDQLVLNGAGASASGRTTVQITNLGGLGAYTTGNGIEVVAARNGATTTAQSTKDAFALSGGHVDAGAFEYRLYAADAIGAGESWYLRTQAPAVTPVGPVTPVSPVTPTSPATPAAPSAAAPAAAPVTTYRAEVPLFAAVPSQLRQADLAMLGTMRTRMGDDDASARAVASLEPVAGMLSADRRAWARGVYSDIDVRQGGTVSPSTQGHVSGIQAGTDLYVSPLGDWRAGLYVGTLDGSADVSGFASGLNRAVGRTDLRSRFVGGYATYANNTGFYVDTVLQYGSQRYTARPYGALETTGKGSSLTAAVEIGQAFALGGGWTWEPQAQLSVRRARLDDANISAARVSQDDGDSWAGGVGVRVKGDFDTSIGRLQPYGRIGVVYNHGGTVVTGFAGPAGFTDIATPSSYTSAELSFGSTLSLTRIVSLYGELGQVYSAGGSTKVKSSVQAAVGVRARW
jgi:fibronectin-binding autotransporter adhesin